MFEKMDYKDSDAKRNSKTKNEFSNKCKLSWKHFCRKKSDRYLLKEMKV